MKTYLLSEMADWIKTLHAGEEILLSGTVYTARDAAHKRLCALLDEHKPLPFPLAGSAIYYAGPTPAKNGLPIGSCGPTTSSRMDPYLPRLFDAGLRLTIGKGDRSPTVYEAIKRYGGAYLLALGGAGALVAQSVRTLDVIAFPELGCESVKRLVIEKLPLYVGIDATGASIFSKH
ncbi:MAG: fumarate hydratase C-terminal domain-containing protein [Clostridia bacterium]|nr:fumarate hydratase C-terminal domain-containing protein [Clostridia bacterium]